MVRWFNCLWRDSIRLIFLGFLFSRCWNFQLCNLEVVLFCVFGWESLMGGIIGSEKCCLFYGVGKVWGKFEVRWIVCEVAVDKGTWCYIGGVELLLGLEIVAFVFIDYLFDSWLNRFWEWFCKIFKVFWLQVDWTIRWSIRLLILRID